MGAGASTAAGQPPPSAAAYKVDQLAEGLDTAVAKGDILHGKAEDFVDKFSGVLDVAEIMLSGVGMIPGLDTLCGNLNLFDLRMLDYK